MSNLFATAGSKIYIGGALAFDGDDFVASDFNAQAWTEIKGVTNLGSAGDTSELLTSQRVSESRVRKKKGTRNAGSIELLADLNYADPGQLALIAAEKEEETHAFRVVFNDAPPGGTASIRYFAALVMSSGEQWNEANSIMALASTLEIDGNIVRVAASMSGSAPNNTALPAITGTAEIGETLTVTPGTWTGTPTPSLAYQWFADGESIPGATGTTYVIQAGNDGQVISVLETATNFHGTAQAMSAATAEVE